MSNKLIRLEVIMDKTIEDIFLEKLDRELKGTAYTLMSGIHGWGLSGPRRGTPVWPEENSLFFLYCTEEKAGDVAAVLEAMKRDHPRNGLTVFCVDSARELFLSPS